MDRFNFEKLKVWEYSRCLVKDIYYITACYPLEEKFGLTSQIRRAAVSVSSNIAEGAGRTSIKDKLRFYEMAYGSLTEVINQIILSVDLGFATEEDLKAIYPKAQEIGKMLSGMRNSLKERYNRPDSAQEPEFDYI